MTSFCEHQAKLTDLISLSYCILGSSLRLGQVAWEDIWINPDPTRAASREKETGVNHLIVRPGRDKQEQ